MLSDGQLVDVKITEIDKDRKKVSLSIRALIEPSSHKAQEIGVASAKAVDNTPVIVYDTDSPPPVGEDDEPEDMDSELEPEEAGEPEVAGEPDEPETLGAPLS